VKGVGVKQEEGVVVVIFLLLSWPAKNIIPSGIPREIFTTSDVDPYMKKMNFFHGKIFDRDFF